jgi:hypothetical protein
VTAADLPLSERRDWSMDPREALRQKKLYGPNVVLPPDFRGMALDDLQKLVDEIDRPRIEAEEAAASARRIADAPLAVGRALQGAPKRRTPARLRVAFLRQLERWGTVSQAAAAVDVDRRTIQRWRRLRPEFDVRCEEALARRGQILEDEGMTRARRATRRPFFYGGKQVGQVEQYNDALLVRLIGQFASRRPQGGPALTADSIATIVRAAVESTIRQMSQNARQAESQASDDK